MPIRLTNQQIDDISEAYAASDYRALREAADQQFQDCANALRTISTGQPDGVREVLCQIANIWTREVI